MFQHFDWQVIAAMITILTGVIMYMLVDVQFNVIGVLLILANTLLALCDRLFQRRLIAVKPVAIPKLGMVFLNNSVGLGPLALLICAFREPGTYSTTMPHAMGPWLLLFSSAAFGTVMGWSSLNAQEATVRSDTALFLGGGRAARCARREAASLQVQLWGETLVPRNSSEHPSFAQSNSFPRA